MGLLDGMDLEDPKTQLLLQMGLGLLGGAPGGRKNFMADLSHAGQQGLMGYSNAAKSKDKRATEAQARELQAIQLQQARQGQQDQSALRSAFTRNVTPGQPQMLPTDMETPSGPSGPSSVNMQGYQNDLLGAGPAGFAEYMKLRQADKPDVMGLKPGEVAYDKRTNKPLFTAPQSSQWKELGRDPMTKQMIMENTATGERKAVGSMPQQVSVKLPQPEKAILKVDEERLGELSTAASSARRFAQTSQIINHALKGQGGGGLIKLGTETAAYLGVKGGTISANDLAESLNIRLATEVRAPGSGSTSNIEFESYRAAAPSLKNSEEGRELMTKVAMKFAERNAKLADYGRSLIRDGKFSDEAIAQYDEKLGSVLGDELKKKLGGGGAPSAGGLSPAEQRELQELRARVRR